jgi:hypothetical protein
LAASDADVLECLEQAGGRRVELAHEIHNCPACGPCSTLLHDTQLHQHRRPPVRHDHVIAASEQQQPEGRK